MATRFNGSAAANTLEQRNATGPVELYGLAGNDQLFGGAWGNVLVGGRGTDVLTGGDGTDVFASTAGDSLVSVTYEKSKTAQFAFNITGQDVVTDFTLGAAGDRIAFSGATLATNGTGDGNDRLFGDNSDDMLSGSIGNDQLTGGAGADELVGGDGADIHNYGAASDSLLAQHDVVAYFDFAEDRFHFDGVAPTHTTTRSFTAPPSSPWTICWAAS